MAPPSVDSPHFINIILDTKSGNLITLSGFAEKPIHENNEVAALRHLDRRWPTATRDYPHKHVAFFSAGWGALARETRLYGETAPVQFIRQHNQGNKQIATLRYSNRSWMVKLRSHGRDRGAFFSAGWPAFVRESCLHVGNVYVFQLHYREDVVFRVYTP